MSLLFLVLLTLAAPSAAFALGTGYAPHLLPLLLGFYWGAFPPLLYGAGRVLEGVLPGVRPPRVRGEVYALALPYLLYWAAARRLGLGFREAFFAFLRGPGLGVPLAALLSLVLGKGLPPLLVSLATLALALLLERAARELWRTA